jgi:hypothetical protein
MKVLLILCLLIFPCFAQERFVKPVDEAAQDTSFLAFRTKLITATQQRDVKYILSIVDKSIKNGFGGNDGIVEFQKQWKIYSRNSAFWAEFLKVITNGGTFDRNNRGIFYAPYLFTNFPEDIDQFEHQAIFGNNVNLRSKPDTTASIVASLSYNVVKVDYQNSVKSPKSEDEFLWLKIETLGGKKGFVKSEFVRSSIDYRAGFEKRRGKWTMTFFLAGD